LAFARRNVAIDKVIAAAEKDFGLQAQIIDETHEGVAMEPIYSFRFLGK
jgi:hypothetical protein